MLRLLLALLVLPLTAQADTLDDCEEDGPGDEAIGELIETGKQLNDFANRGAACYDKAAEMLARSDPAGLRVLQKTDKPYFVFWLDCKHLARSLGAAIHESIHKHSNYRGRNRQYSFYQPHTDSHLLAPVMEKEFFVRSRIKKYLSQQEQKESYFQIYFTGKTGEQGFLVLLDELNAYTHGLNTDYALRGHMPANMQSGVRDGLAAMMLYTQYYLKLAREEHPELYAEMLEKMKPLLNELWTNAETAMKQAFKDARLGINDKIYLKGVYSPALFSEIAPFLSDPNPTSHTYVDPKELAAAKPLAAAVRRGPKTPVGTKVMSRVSRGDKTVSVEVTKLKDGFRIKYLANVYSLAEFRAKYPDPQSLERYLLEKIIDDME